MNDRSLTCCYCEDGRTSRGTRILDLAAKGRARRTAEARRERIITAARALFARHGFHATGMAEIARVSEVLVGQIYRDFAGKEDLIAAIVERDVTQLLDDPEMIGAIEAGRVDQMNSWVHGFVCRQIDKESRSVLADILSEATRNPRIAALVSSAHDQLRERLVVAAMLWAPGPERYAERQELAELILTAAGAIQHRQIFGLEENAGMMARMVALVDAEIARLSTTGQEPVLSAGVESRRETAPACGDEPPTSAIVSLASDQ